MSSLFADTHNVVAILEKSDAAEGFEKIIDFLSGSYIYYALTSAKRTFWNEFSTTMASAVICLSKGQRFNFLKYIFDSLVRNANSSSKFYMYPRFIQLIIQAQVGDLSTYNIRFISSALTQKVFANIRGVRKGFSRVETPLFKGMIADRQPAEEELGAEQVQVDAAVATTVVEDVAENVAHVATPSPPPHGIASPPQGPHRLEIVKLKARVKKLEQTDKGRMMNEDKGIELVKDDKIAKLEGRQADKQEEIYKTDLDHSSKVLNMQEDDSEVQDVVEVVTTAKLITEVVTAVASQVSAVSTTIPAASATIPAAKLSILAAAPTVVAVYTRKRKGVTIRDPEEDFPLKFPAETPKVKDKGKGILVEAPKPMKKKDQ
nr:hypothetical protein [Tanacetum cinerariifolium]